MRMKPALVAGVALGLAATAYGMPFAAADSKATVQQTVTPPDAATIERQWVAANRPYDEARKAILAQVHKTAWQGPVQPEWQSLTAYRAPDELGWPATGHVLIHLIGPTLKVTAVTLLATGKSVLFRQQPDGLHLDLPAQPAGVHAYAYRIGLDARGKEARTTGMASLADGTGGSR